MIIFSSDAHPSRRVLPHVVDNPDHPSRWVLGNLRDGVRDSSRVSLRASIRRLLFSDSAQPFCDLADVDHIFLASE